jgi:uncharacterized membrane protein YphA (DoxX/SURF4 family)
MCHACALAIEVIKPRTEAPENLGAREGEIVRARHLQSGSRALEVADPIRRVGSRLTISPPGQRRNRETRMKKMLYITATAFAVVVFAITGVADLMRAPAVTASMQHLGYPMYLLTILGIWKLLGSAAIAVPGFSRLKEWAYAGMFFDVTGAAISHVVSDDSMAHIVPPLALLAVVMTSWYSRPASSRAVWTGHTLCQQSRRGSLRRRI